MKTIAAVGVIVTGYVLAFLVNPWVAGAFLAFHSVYEWCDYQEHKAITQQLQFFKNLDNLETLEEKKEAGNC